MVLAVGRLPPRLTTNAVLYRRRYYIKRGADNKFLSLHHTRRYFRAHLAIRFLGLELERRASAISSAAESVGVERHSSYRRNQRLISVRAAWKYFLYLHPPRGGTIFVYHPRGLPCVAVNQKDLTMRVCHVSK